VSNRIPTEIRQFVARFLPSVAHLETFIALQKDPMRWWNAAELAEDVRIGEATAADVLEQFASANFLAVRISGDILYRFNPATRAIESISSRCRDWYIFERPTMIDFIKTAAHSRRDDFSGLFRSKNDGDD
jgi:hypothetical protein